MRSSSGLVSLFLAALAVGAHGMGGGSAGGADWRYFLAGGISAATSHGITTPIDVVKTRMQLNPAKYSGNVMAAAKDIVETEGPAFLLQGLGATVVGYGCEGAMKFGCYELFKPIFGSLTPSAFANALLASVVAGGVASVILCPAEGTRIRMVSDPTFAAGMVGGLLRLLREDGVLEVFNGLAAMLSKQVPYTAAKQVSFDVLATAFYNVPAMVKRAWTITFVSSVITSVIATIASQPGDVVLTEVYKPPPPQAQMEPEPVEVAAMEAPVEEVEMTANEPPSAPSGGYSAEADEVSESLMTAVPAGGADYAAPSGEVYPPPKQYFDKFTNKNVVPPKLKKATTAAIASDIFRRKGIGGFFVGTKARLGHVGGIITSQLAIYDFVKQACGLAATGSH
mmetsp:Transcript_6151/g.15169  ORF Transcript_6151/g.15169 Transcript_6151/m.15169 type:complete len:396 (-) Transcript_6151:1375-2562(-)